MSNRIDRINSEVQKTLTKILATELKDPRLSGMITITKTEVSADLSHAKVFVSILAKNKKDEQQDFQILCKSAGYIRKSLSQKLNMRLTPELHFFIDTTWEEAAKMDRLLDSLNIKPEGNWWLFCKIY